MTYPKAADLIRRRLAFDEQTRLVAAIAQIVTRAPFYRPALPRWGTPFSVQMTNCGPLGWLSDKAGYRYSPAHPVTGEPWPPIPAMLLDLWTDIGSYAAPPEACLVNYYAPGAKMGLHQNKDEAALDAPVVSVSLGDDARFRLGGREKGDPTSTTLLASGDVLLLAGETRLAFHGIDKLDAGTSKILAGAGGVFAQGGRVNLTLRRVTKP